MARLTEEIIKAHRTCTCIRVSVYRGSLIKSYHQESHRQEAHMEHSGPASPPGLVPKGTVSPKPGDIPLNRTIAGE